MFIVEQINFAVGLHIEGTNVLVIMLRSSIEVGVQKARSIRKALPRTSAPKLDLVFQLNTNFLSSQHMAKELTN